MDTIKLNDDAPTSTTGGTTSDLKKHFSAGSIPLDTDFSELIDIAECGRRAVGQSADQSDNSIGIGLTLSSASASVGKLAVLAKPDSGITVDSKGVGFDQTLIFQKGMIIMYNDGGTHTVPEGWAICDGSNGTPDLTKKFVMGGSWAGETNNLSMSGSSGSRQAAGKAQGATANITNNATNAHALTKDEMPAHTHELGGKNDSSHYLNYQDGTVDFKNDFHAAGSNGGGHDADRIYALSTGGDSGHSHTITQTEHMHDIQVDIPYYTLMYIMKL